MFQTKLSSVLDANNLYVKTFSILSFTNNTKIIILECSVVTYHFLVKSVRKYLKEARNYECGNMDGATEGIVRRWDFSHPIFILVFHSLPSFQVIWVKVKLSNDVVKFSTFFIFVHLIVFFGQFNLLVILDCWCREKTNIFFSINIFDFIF